MKVAKIISIIGVLISLFFLFGLFSFNYSGTKIYSKNTGFAYSPTPLIFLGILIQLGFVLANAGFFYYLNRKESRGEKVNNAIIYSILIAVLPLLLFRFVFVLSYGAPIF